MAVKFKPKLRHGSLNHYNLGDLNSSTQTGSRSEFFPRSVFSPACKTPEKDFVATSNCNHHFQE